MPTVLAPDMTVTMSSSDKIAEAMRRSIPKLPSEAQDTVRQMLTPVSLGIIAATLVVWAGSHFFGVGEIVDLILLVVGVVTLGFSVFQGARELMDFAKTAVNARSDRELDQAADYFAKAVTLLGISVVQAVLLHGQAKLAIARGRPVIRPRIGVGTPPEPGNTLRVERNAQLPPGVLGSTDAYGTIQLAKGASLSAERQVLYHELMHRYLSPRTGPMRQLRAELAISGYVRSAFLKYLEEAMAEFYGQLHVYGLQDAVAAWRFPITNGYVTVAQLQAEGAAIGTIMLGGAVFHVSMSVGPIPADR